MPVESRAVISPIFSGILALKKGIISTLAVTIPIPVKAVPRYRTAIPPWTRRTTPMASSSIPKKIALLCPNFLPKNGANKEKMAKVIRLSVVKNPASPLDIPRSSRIKGINGPTDAMEVRRLIEIKITPRISTALEEDLSKEGLNAR